ncbi:hypothetical protein OAT67_05725 [Bacteriovoracaceae bacterium]|nr:hypothetical protein [Bacteriovoracaceae bacterium]MDC1174869.1 hypothetical protein [Bacteriovoracaceae bacterium]
MKKLLTVLLMTLIMTPYAQGFDLYKNIEKLEKVEVKKVKANTRAVGFETFRGEVMSLRDVKKKWFKKKTLKEVLSREEIELVNGQILYPEEVEFGLVINTRLGDKNRAPHGDDERAPHTPN